jgi:hypothetical protein
LALARARKEQKLHETLVFTTLREKMLSAFLRRVEAKSDTTGSVATTHGFRSSFRDCASESDAAYHRTDLLEQHRPLVEACARHVMSSE